MIPKIFVIMVWIMVIGVQADPKGKVYPIGNYSEKKLFIARVLGLKDDCRAIMGDCAKSCPDLRFLTDPEIDACTELDKLRKGCFSTCPPCVHEGLAKLEEDFRKRLSTCKPDPRDCDENTSWRSRNGFGCEAYGETKRGPWCENGRIGSATKSWYKWPTDINGFDARSVCCVCGGSGYKKSQTCDKDQDCTDKREWLCINGKCVDDFLIGNNNTLCAREAVIRDAKYCQQAAILYGRDFVKIERGDPLAIDWMGGCSMRRFETKIVFNDWNYGYMDIRSKPICRRKETIEKNNMDEMIKEMISTAKDNKAQISYLRSKVKTVVELEPIVNGKWGTWGDYSTCSKTCGTGLKTRTRTCNNPSPSGGGLACPGLSSESINCNPKRCPDISVQYDDAITTKWCRDSRPIEGRNKCDSDEQCLKNARGLCDDDSNCVGVMWFSGNPIQKLRLCESRILEGKTDGWRTLLKSNTMKKVEDEDDNGFEGFIVGVKETCATKFQIGRNTVNEGEDTCRERCRSDTDCKYYFYTFKETCGNQEWCVLYKDCSERRIPGCNGRTFRKTD